MAKGKKDRIKVGDKVSLREIPALIFGRVKKIEGKTAYVFWRGFTEPGKLGEVPLKSLDRVS